MPLLPNTYMLLQVEVGFPPAEGTCFIFIGTGRYYYTTQKKGSVSK